MLVSRQRLIWPGALAMYRIAYEESEWALDDQIAEIDGMRPPMSPDAPRGPEKPAGPMPQQSEPEEEARTPWVPPERVDPFRRGSRLGSGGVKLDTDLLLPPSRK